MSRQKGAMALPSLETNHSQQCGRMHNDFSNPTNKSHVEPEMRHRSLADVLACLCIHQQESPQAQEQTQAEA